MSFKSALAGGFKNFGHAIAVGAKYIAIGVKDVAKVAAKEQAIEPELELLVGALAGPVGAKVVSLGSHLLGDISNAIVKAGDDAEQVAATTGFNLTLDATLVNDIKTLIPVLTAIAKSGGQPVPEAK